MNKYNVTVQYIYEGVVEVFAFNEDEAIEKALFEDANEQPLFAHDTKVELIEENVEDEEC